MPIELGPHNLTSDTSNPPFVVSSSTSIPGSRDDWRAFDGNSTSFWLGTNSGVDWLAIDLGAAQLLGSYKIVIYDYPSGAPNSWTMEGSPDGTTWTVVDTRSGEAGWVNFEARTYTCATVATAYRYFRVNVTAINGGAPYTGIQELSLFLGYYANEFAPHDLTSNTSHSPYVVSASSEDTFDNADAFHAFDGLATVGGALKCWLGTGAGTDWLKLDTGGSYLISAYSVRSGASGVTRAPNTWTMQGSPDGTTWTTLDTRSGETSWNAIGEMRTYAVTGVTTDYRYFRLNITANNGDSTYTEVDELLLRGAPLSLTAQTITFPTIPNHTSLDAPFALTATSDSGLTVSYAVTSGPATISGSTVTLTGAIGSVTIEATQAGNGTYSAATPVSESFTVGVGQRGNIAYDQIKASDRTGDGNQLLTWTTTVPATAGAAGNAGQLARDSGFLYVCVGSNVWVRVTISTW